VNHGFPTFFVKVRAHEEEPYIYVAYTATHDDDSCVPLLSNAPSGRIIYQLTPDSSESEEVLYTASMNDTVMKFIKNQAALSSLYIPLLPLWGHRILFLRRPHSSRDLLGLCLSDSSFPAEANNRLMQSVGFQFPFRTLLHQWGTEASPNCSFCHEKESMGHVQSRCKSLERPRIVAHHMIWREILLQLLSPSGDEGDEHKWAIAPPRRVRLAHPAQGQAVGVRVGVCVRVCARPYLMQDKQKKHG
jgi:hypothetical protein